MDAEAVLKERIIELPDYPKKGVIFRDITPMLKDNAAFRLCVDELAKRLDARPLCTSIVPVSTKISMISGRMTSLEPHSPRVKPNI